MLACSIIRRPGKEGSYNSYASHPPAGCVGSSGPCHVATVGPSWPNFERNGRSVWCYVLLSYIQPKEVLNPPPPFSHILQHVTTLALHSVSMASKGFRGFSRRRFGPKPQTQAPNLNKTLSPKPFGATGFLNTGFRPFCRSLQRSCRPKPYLGVRASSGPIQILRV